MIELTDGVVDLNQGQVRRSDRVVALTQRERAVLAYLVARPACDVPRAELLTEVFGYSDQVLSRAVDTALRRLREKIEVEPASPRHLLTVFGVGYRYEPLRRGASPPPAPVPRTHGTVVLGQRSVDLDLGLVRGPDVDQTLTTTELAVVRHLVSRGGALVGRSELQRAVWNRAVAASAITSTLHRLRTKLEPNPDRPIYLLTLRGTGYRLRIPNAFTEATVVLVAVAVHRETELWREARNALPDAMAEALAELDRTALEAGGVRFGEGWRYGFSDPVDAIRWAFGASGIACGPVVLQVAAHRGRHVAATDPVTGRSLALGPVFHRATHLVGLAPPGSVVVDRALWDEVGPAIGAPSAPLPGGALLLGLAGPVTGQASLPWRGDRFVGRVRLLAELRRALDPQQPDGSRLVTLVGPAGVGKSRLALELAAGLEAPGGVWFVGCADVGTADDLIGRVAAPLGVPVGEADPAERLLAALARRAPTVLWLDDCERMLAHAELIGRWLSASPRLTVVASSRRSLGLAGERVFQVPPLDLDEAIDLFRCRAPRPEADPDSEAALVRELDGLPLAIELAAARTAALTVRQLLERLPDRLRLLARPGADPTDRQASLAAALDVSWDLLSPAERAVLAQVTVFRGGFTLEAAQRTVDWTEFPEAPWVVDLIEGLVRQNLLWVDGDRYRILDGVHAYAATHLDDDARLRAEVAHAAAFAPMGSRALLAELDRYGLRGQSHLVSEIPNLEIMAERAIDRLDAERAAVATIALAAIRLRGSTLGRALDLLDRVLATFGTGMPHEPRLLSLRAAIRYQLGGHDAGALADLVRAEALALASGDHQSAARALLLRGPLEAARGRKEEELRCHEVALDRARAGGHADEECMALMSLGSVAARSDGGRAMALLERALKLAIDLGRSETEGLVLGLMGMIERRRGDPARARVLQERALAVARSADNRLLETTALLNLANAVATSEGLLAARPLWEEALVACRSIGNARTELLVLLNLGAVHQRTGALDLALTRYQESLDIALRLRRRRHEGKARVSVGQALTKLGRAEPARRELELARAIGEEVGDGQMIGESYLVQAELEPLDQALTLLEAALAVLRPIDRMLVAEALCKRASLLATVDPTAARAALDEAAALADGLGPDSELAQTVARTRRALSS